MFLLGDMNVNHQNKSSPAFKKLNFLVRSNGLSQHISSTTRNTDNSKSLIDLAISNLKHIKFAGTLKHYVSDHQPIYVVHKKARDSRASERFEGQSYRTFDRERFGDMLTGLDWTEFYNQTDSAAAWEYLLDKITVILDQMCPVRTFHIKNYRPDWMTKELIEQIKDRDYFYRKAKETGDRD